MTDHMKCLYFLLFPQAGLLMDAERIIVSKRKICISWSLLHEIVHITHCLLRPFSSYSTSQRCGTRTIKRVLNSLTKISQLNAYLKTLENEAVLVCLQITMYCVFNN